MGLFDELFPIKVYADECYPYRLTASEKLYLGLYDSANGDITKVDIVMSNVVSKTTLNKIKSNLSSLHLIDLSHNKFISSEDAKEFTINNSHSGKICEWCGKESYVLQKHHYPIPHSKGGKDVVNICPNCHYTYHTVMEDYE